MSDFFDIDSYLNRIGLPAPTDEQRYQDGLILLRDIMAAHSRTIPFENLDIVLKRNLPVSLESMELEAKMVAGGRGGYCFENNLLLCFALRALGFGVTPMLARVRWNKPPGDPQPLGHLVLLVTLPQWPADGGSRGARGGNSERGTNSIAPVAAASAEVQQLPEGHFRLLSEPFGCTGSGGMYSAELGQPLPPPLSDKQFVLQRQVRGTWRDLYMVRNEPACDADISQANWYNCTHPDARFVSSFFVSRVVGDERHHIPDGSINEEVVTSRARLMLLLTSADLRRSVSVPGRGAEARAGNGAGYGGGQSPDEDEFGDEPLTPQLSVHLRVAGYYSWSLPYSGEKGELGTAFTFAVDGMCGFPGCPLPERHPGPHQIAVVDSKRKRQPKPQFGS
ncbi:hypothetical protein EMIHUDRAFT_222756 [Emiliania huxleyi CCMP1516]|uniref:Arylamine N-acetyltransferase n=2 Tax=Emiliania huxleyi TaxID=2903 RepID=A0A0D3KX41_EMIH1|nr:hypothetical protein EMIHUDRAFT_222756 [Emiliania huxleyi CCMP1516]EOD40326.1 hypothetical protein EMIHUDRAFT_222756 [Emiliania huxleyi CCMP1516]|eukprot:XP_005792755.1 hypothetical protein EMIHUDRAFT_222756 [Emiliania huxleyi CCMP1516]